MRRICSWTRSMRWASYGRMSGAAFSLRHTRFRISTSLLPTSKLPSVQSSSPVPLPVAVVASSQRSTLPFPLSISLSLSLSLSLSSSYQKKHSKNKTKQHQHDPVAGSLTHSIQRSQICVFCDFVCSRIGFLRRLPRVQQRGHGDRLEHLLHAFCCGIHPSHVLHLHPSLCVIHSFITTSSSSSLLRYSFVHFTYCIFIQLIAPVCIHPFIHHHFSIQLFAAVFIRSSHALLLHPSLGCSMHSSITTSASSSLLQYSFVNPNAFLLYPSLCVIQSFITASSSISAEASIHLTHCFFIHLFALFIHLSPLFSVLIHYHGTKQARSTYTDRSGFL